MDVIRKNWYSFFLNTILILGSIFYVLPNLSTKKSDYELHKEILKSTRIDTRESIRKFRKREERTLVLEMINGHEWKISNQYAEYWDKLQDTNNIGKEISLYAEGNITIFHNPIQIEIDNKVIYDTKTAMQWKYLILLLTISLTIYNTLKYKEII